MSPPLKIYATFVYLFVACLEAEGRQKDKTNSLPLCHSPAASLGPAKTKSRNMSQVSM